jgi:RPA family protein
MKTRTYKTTDGGTVTSLRPETELENAVLEAAVLAGQDLDTRHSLGDDIKRVKKNTVEETKEDDT